MWFSMAEGGLDVSLEPPPVLAEEPLEKGRRAAAEGGGTAG